MNTNFYMLVMCDPNYYAIYNRKYELVSENAPKKDVLWIAQHRATQVRNGFRLTAPEQQPSWMKDELQNQCVCYHLYKDSDLRKDGNIIGPDKVYIIEAEELGIYKIGVSNNLKIRLQRLQTASPVKLRIIASLESPQNAYHVESTLHEELHQYRLHGEWFRLPLDIIKSLLRRFGN